jgi:hypothetical protein
MMKRVIRLRAGFLLVIAVGLLLPSTANAATQYKRFDYSGWLPGATTGPATITEAFGINDRKQVVGSFCANGDPNFVTVQGCGPPNGSNPSHGYLAKATGRSRPTNFTAINFIAPDGTVAFETEAIGINLNVPAKIIGLYDLAKPTPQTMNLDTGVGFICTEPCQTKESFQTIKFPGSASTDGQAINDSGVAVGLTAFKANPPFKDFGWMRTPNDRWCRIDIGKMGGPSTAVDTNANGLNNNNDVVGSYDDGSSIKGFRLTNVRVPTYTGTPPTCLSDGFTSLEFAAGVPQTEAAGINDRKLTGPDAGFGVIVGNYLDSNNVSHAWRWSKSLGFQDVSIPQPLTNPPGDNAALAINNHNTIVANFEDTKKAKKERAWIRFE